MSHSQLIKDTLDEVRTNEAIVVSSASFEPCVFDPERLSASFTRNTGVVLPPNLKEWLNFPERTQLSWQSRATGASSPAGYFGIENLENCLLMDRNRVPIHNPDMDPETQRILRRCRYFDTFPDFGWDIATVVHDDRERGRLDLYFLDREVLGLLELDLGGYLEACMATKGMVYWQYLFCPAPMQRAMNAYKRPYIDRILPFLTHTFPAHDYSALAARHRDWATRTASP